MREITWGWDLTTIQNRGNNARIRLILDAIPSAEVARETLHSRLLPWAISGIALHHRQWVEWVEMRCDRLHS